MLFYSFCAFLQRIQKPRASSKTVSNTVGVQTSLGEPRTRVWLYEKHEHVEQTQIALLAHEAFFAPIARNAKRKLDWEHDREWHLNETTDLTVVG